MTLQTSADDVQPQTRNSPVIVGDNYELVETVGAGYVGELLGGLLAKPDGQGTLLSMSSYEKSPNTDLSGESCELFKAHLSLRVQPHQHVRVIHPCRECVTFNLVFRLTPAFQTTMPDSPHRAMLHSQTTILAGLRKNLCT